jgi:hypothetical protein
VCLCVFFLVERITKPNTLACVRKIVSEMKIAYDLKGCEWAAEAWIFGTEFTRLSDGGDSISESSRGAPLGDCEKLKHDENSVEKRESQVCVRVCVWMGKTVPVYLRLGMCWSVLANEWSLIHSQIQMARIALSTQPRPPCVFFLLCFSWVIPV